MFLDRSVSFSSLVTWLLWSAGAVLALGDWAGFTSTGSGFFGIVLVAAGHCLTICRIMQTMRQRERDAFELGVEAARMHAVH